MYDVLSLQHAEKPVKIWLIARSKTSQFDDGRGVDYFLGGLGKNRYCACANLFAVAADPFCKMFLFFW